MVIVVGRRLSKGVKPSWPPARTTAIETTSRPGAGPRPYARRTILTTSAVGYGLRFSTITSPAVSPQNRRRTCYDVLESKPSDRPGGTPMTDASEPRVIATITPVNVVVRMPAVFDAKF